VADGLVTSELQAVLTIVAERATEVPAHWKYD
jgi:hypothetical protein